MKIRGVDFEAHDDYFVRFQKEDMIMVTPKGDPKDPTVKWEGFLHDPAGNVLESIESYTAEAVVVIAKDRGWIKGVEEPTMPQVVRSDGRTYGPFADEVTARRWLRDNHRSGRVSPLYSPE